MSSPLRPTEGIDADADADALPSLHVIGASGATVHPLASFKAESVLGRDSSSAIVLDDASVSRRHARVTFDESTPLIEDLGSRNGVRMDGRKLAVGEKVPLRVGAIAELGRVIVVLRPAGAPKPVPQVAQADTAMGHVERLISLVAPSAISVILAGETGVGKEVVAERIHAGSPRGAKPFIAINCGALSEALLESELFGHEKGAFTGATQAKVGLLEAAAGGTVFFDELGEMPPATQVKLLRALEKREVVPVGGVRPRAFDARVIAATHRDLEAMCAAGTFRSDLYYRLNGITISIPPLRERRDEIPTLTTLFLRRLGDVVISDRAMRRLSEYAWPGNVRELKNIVERAHVLAGGGAVDEAHILLPAARPSAAGTAHRASADSGAVLADEVADFEKQKVLDALAAANNVQKKAAEILGISLRALNYRLEVYKISTPRKPR